MDLLARREYTIKELSDKLTRRFAQTVADQGHTIDGDVIDGDVAGCGDNVIDEVTLQLQRLSAEGLQSDSRMAENFVRAAVSKGHGPLKIRMNLRAKGVDDQLIDQTLEAAAICWQEMAASVLKKRFGSEPITDMKSRGRRARFLQQRGFSFDVIHSLLQ